MLDSDDNAIETVDSNGNVVANLVAGDADTELTLRFTATYTVDTEDKGNFTNLWADFGSGTLMSAVPSNPPRRLGLAVG